MVIYEFLTELFAYESIKTEYTAYTILSRHPLATNVDYLAAPWSVLINKRRLSDRAHLPALPQLQHGCTVCQHISYEQILPILIEIGIKTLFTPHVCRSYPDIEVLPFPHLAVNGTGPADHKDILYSFVGCVSTHPTRRILCRLPKHQDIIMVCKETWHFESKDRPTEEARFKKVLSRSRFSLCPRGTGASTIRFWESLQAGAIPVLISDDMKLPANWDWKNTIIRIPEKDTIHIDGVVRRVSAQREAELRTHCLCAADQFSGVNLVSSIGHRFVDAK